MTRTWQPIRRVLAKVPGDAARGSFAEAFGQEGPPHG